MNRVRENGDAHVGVANGFVNGPSAESPPTNGSAQSVSVVPVDRVTHALGINSDSCYFCLGFYGPSFGQPVCGPCHAFLFPEFVRDAEGSEESGTSGAEEKEDSGDSGNEEPSSDYLAAIVTDGSSGATVASFAGAASERKRRVARSARLENDGSGAGAGAGAADNLSSHDDGEPTVNTASSVRRSSFHSCGSDHAAAAARSARTNSGGAGPGLSKLADKLLQLTTTRDKEIVPPRLVDSLPPEVLIAIFSYLDDLSLWKAMQVSPRWRQIIHDEYPEEKWRACLRLRWPLYEPLISPRSWRDSYSRLAQSAPCQLCLDQMMLTNPSPIEENSWRHRRLRSELKALKSDPPEGIQATPLDRFYCHWQATITGPQGSPYEGGIFFLFMQIPPTYPMKPPVVRFLTRTFHPNISRHGDIGLDSLYHNWSLALTISKVLISIQSLLTDPYLETSMEPSIGEIIREDPVEYNRIARIWTWRYAMHDVLISGEDCFDGP